MPFLSEDTIGMVITGKDVLISTKELNCLWVYAFNTLSVLPKRKASPTKPRKIDKLFKIIEKKKKNQKGGIFVKERFVEFQIISMGSCKSFHFKKIN